MDKTDKPSQGMLNFIRELLSQHMNAERAKNLSDDEIAWIAPLVQHELDKLNTRSRDIVILRYGLYGREPLSYEKVGIQVGKEKPLTRERVRQIEARALQKLKRFSTELNNTEARMATEALKAYKKGQYAQWMHAQENGDRGAVNAYVHNYRACVNAINKIEIQKQIRKYRDQTEWNGVERSGTE